MVDDVAVWTMAQASAAAGDFVRTPPIPIQGRRGTRQLTVALYGVGSVNASLSIRNLEVEQSDTPSPGAAATLGLSKPALNFGAVTGPGTLPALTSAQTLRLTQSGGAPVTWMATADRPWITVSPSSGTGSANLTVSINNVGNALPASGTLSGTITVTANGALNSPSAAVVLKVTPAGQTSAPFGLVDTPLQGATGLTGSIAVTGWALDDLGVTRVRILRDPIAGEGGVPVYIGEASLVDGAQPDVAAAYPTLPRNMRGGWGYLLLTNFLPNEGNGSFTLHAYADDVEGRSTLLGSRVIGVSNASAINPFGAIDTPGQGELISGVVNNFGWVLGSGGRRADVPSGGSVNVFVDGVRIGSPAGWSGRADLAALFPVNRYPGVSSALAVHTFDTRTLAEGVHTIAWGVTDNQGNSAGVGSRYFTVANGANALTADAVASTALRTGPGTDEIRGRRGFETDTPWRSVLARCRRRRDRRWGRARSVRDSRAGPHLGSPVGRGPAGAAADRIASRSRRGDVHVAARRRVRRRLRVRVRNGQRPAVGADRPAPEGQRPRGAASGDRCTGIRSSP